MTRRLYLPTSGPWPRDALGSQILGAVGFAIFMAGIGGFLSIGGG